LTQATLPAKNFNEQYLITFDTKVFNTLETKDYPHEVTATLDDLTKAATKQLQSKFPGWRVSKIELTLDSLDVHYQVSSKASCGALASDPGSLLGGDINLKPTEGHRDDGVGEDKTTGDKPEGTRPEKSKKP
jgi:hypothetical protein